MGRKALPGLTVVLIALSVVAAWHVRAWWRIDRCLDHGGRWSYAKDRCEHDESCADADEVGPKEIRELGSEASEKTNVAK